MRRRHQFSTAALMALVFCTGVVLALLRDPLVRAALIGLALGSVLFVLAASVIYGCVRCVVLVVRLAGWLWSRNWGYERVFGTSHPSSPAGN